MSDFKSELDNKQAGDIDDLIEFQLDVRGLLKAIQCVVDYGVCETEMEKSLRYILNKFKDKWGISL